MPEPISEKTLEKDLIRLMVVRVILVSLLLGISAGLHFSGRSELPYSTLAERVHYILIASVYFLSIIWAANFTRIQNKIKLAYTQLIFDAMTVTVMVYITGGIQSIFSLLYFLVIISAGFIVGKRAGYILASVCAILYGGLVDLHYYGIITPFGYLGSPVAVYPETLFLYRVTVHIFAFYLVAFLTGLLSQRLINSIRNYKKLQSLTSSLLNNMVIGVILADNKCDFLYMNPKANQLLERSNKEESEQLLAHIRELLHKVKNDGKNQLSRWQLLELPGEHGISYYHIMVSEIFTPGEVDVAYTVYVQDITEQRLMEKELKRMEHLALVGGLAARVAHEVKNPLAVINTVVELLEEEEGQNPARKRLFDIASKEIARIRTMIQDLLMLARPKKPFLKETKILDLLEELLGVLKRIKGNKNVRLLGEIEREFSIKTDPELLRQALTNILLNSLEAVGEMGDVSIHLALVSESGKRLAIAIRDNGPGFSEAAMKNLFIPFFTTKEKGSGLGLVISKSIVESLGGSISVENLRPTGAQVTITLPI